MELMRPHTRRLPPSAVHTQQFVHPRLAPVEHHRVCTYVCACEMKRSHLTCDRSETDETFAERVCGVLKYP